MKKKFILIFVLLMSFFFVLTPMVQAQSVNDALKGLNDSARHTNAFKESVDKTNYNNFLQTKTGQLVGIVLSFVGVLFLILMIYAGITWMTATGNEQKVSNAKDLMINAIIGIIIIFAAYAITKFIGDQILK